MATARELFEVIDEFMATMEFKNYVDCHLFFTRDDGKRIVLLASDENRVQKFEQIFNENFLYAGLVFFREGSNRELECLGFDAETKRSDRVERMWHEYIAKTLSQDSEMQ